MFAGTIRIAGFSSVLRSVVIESVCYISHKEIYLDQGPSETTTAAFFEAKGGWPKNNRRSYMGDTYGDY